MKYQDFENKLSGQLYNEEMYVNIPSLLQDLGLEKKKRRIGLLPFLLAGIFLLMSGLLIYAFNANENRKVDGSNTSLTSIASAQNTPVNADQPAEDVNSQQSIIEHAAETNNQHLHSISQNNSNINSNNILSKTKKAHTSHFTSTLPTDNQNGTQSALIELASQVKNEMVASQSSNLNEAINIQNLPLLMQTLSTTSALPSWHKDIECPTFNKKSNFYFELIPEVGIFKPFKELEALNAEPTSAFTAREANEKSLEGIQAGLFIKLRNNKSPFSFRTGLEYQQLTEKMKFDYNYVTRDTTIGIISITVSQTGDTTTIIRGPIITETTHSGSRVDHHQFRTFDIPFVLGYEKNMGSFDVGVEAGVSLNISLRSNGTVLGNDGTYASLPDNSLYRSSLGLNYLGSIYFAKNFESLGRFYLAARGRFIPNAFNSATNSVKQSYTYAGLHLGYIFTF